MGSHDLLEELRKERERNDRRRWWHPSSLIDWVLLKLRLRHQQKVWACAMGQPCPDPSKCPRRDLCG